MLDCFTAHHTYDVRQQITSEVWDMHRLVVPGEGILWQANGRPGM